MNKNTLQYKPRWLAGSMAKALSSHRVLVLTGARQTGKSTLLLRERPFKNWPYVTLDDYQTMQQAKEAPGGLWAGRSKLIIDEAQKWPDVLPAAKAAVDGGRLRLVLSGSSNLLLMKQISESLAGRAVYFHLGPMCLGETEENRPNPNLARLLAGKRIATGPAGKIDYARLMVRGMMPPLLRIKDYREWTRWWEGYTATYLERDLRQLSLIDSLPEYRRLMAALALRSGGPLNQNELSRELGISQPTVYRYLGLLEATNIVTRVPAYFRNRGLRLIKSTKAYFMDAGLVSYLSGCYDPGSLPALPNAGGIFETLVLSHLQALAGRLVPQPRIYYWRTIKGDEVDFVLEQGNSLLPIEVKLSRKAGYGDAGNLRLFLKMHPEAKIGLIVHGGETVSQIDENIFALPLSAIG